MSEEEYDFSQALTWFASLDDVARENFVRACESADPSIDLPLLARRISAATGRNPDQTRGLLTGLGGILGLVGYDPDVRHIAANYIVSLIAEPARIDEAAKRHIDRLLRCERSIGLSSKAQGVMWGQGRVFKHAQTISQIRPVFQSDLETCVDSAVIVHDLRIDYREGTFDSAWSVAMNGRQIEGLIEALKRALCKEDNIRKTNAFHFLDSEYA